MAQSEKKTIPSRFEGASFRRMQKMQMIRPFLTSEHQIHFDFIASHQTRTELSIFKELYNVVERNFIKRKKTEPDFKFGNIPSPPGDTWKSGDSIDVEEFKKWFKNAWKQGWLTWFSIPNDSDSFLKWIKTAFEAPNKELVMETLASIVARMATMVFSEEPLEPFDMPKQFLNEKLSFESAEDLVVSLVEQNIDKIVDYSLYFAYIGKKNDESNPVVESSQEFDENECKQAHAEEKNLVLQCIARKIFKKIDSGITMLKKRAQSARDARDELVSATATFPKQWSVYKKSKNRCNQRLREMKNDKSLEESLEKKQKEIEALQSSLVQKDQHLQWMLQQNAINLLTNNLSNPRSQNP